MPTQDLMNKISLLFSFMYCHYVQTGRLIRAEFYPDDGFKSATLYEVGEDSVGAVDVQLGLDEAIDYMGGLEGGD